MDRGETTDVAISGLSNAVPLVGILALGWNPTAMVFVYFFSTIVVGVFYAIRSLFVAPPARGSGYPYVGIRSRIGTVELQSWLPPLRPQNAPYAAVSLCAIGLLFLVFLALLMLGVRIGAMELTPAVRRSIAVGTASVVLGQVVSLGEFFNRERYRTITAGGQARRLLTYVGLFLPVTLVGVVSPTAAVLGLSLLSVGKDAYEVRSAGSGLGDAGVDSETYAARFPDDESIVDAQPYADHRPDEEEEPIAVYRGGGASGLLKLIDRDSEGVIPAPLGIFVVFTMFMLFPAIGIGVLGGIITNSQAGTTVVFVLTIATLWALIVGGLAALIGWIEVRLYEDAVVYHSTLLGQPQAIVPYDAVEQVVRDGNYLGPTVELPAGVGGPLSSLWDGGKTFLPVILASVEDAKEMEYRIDERGESDAERESESRSKSPRA